MFYLILAATLILSHPAQAQIEEIVVTAQKRAGKRAGRSYFDLRLLR